MSSNHLKTIDPAVLTLTRSGIVKDELPHFCLPYHCPCRPFESGASSKEILECPKIINERIATEVNELLKDIVNEIERPQASRSVEEADEDDDYGLSNLFSNATSGDPSTFQTVEGFDPNDYIDWDVNPSKSQPLSVIDIKNMNECIRLVLDKENESPPAPGSTNNGPLPEPATMSSSQLPTQNDAIASTPTDAFQQIPPIKTPFPNSKIQLQALPNANNLPLRTSIPLGTHSIPPTPVPQQLAVPTHSFIPPSIGIHHSPSPQVASYGQITRASVPTTYRASHYPQHPAGVTPNMNPNKNFPNYAPPPASVAPTYGQLMMSARPSTSIIRQDISYPNRMANFQSSGIPVEKPMTPTQRSDQVQPQTQWNANQFAHPSYTRGTKRSLEDMLTSDPTYLANENSNPVKRQQVQRFIPIAHPRSSSNHAASASRSISSSTAQEFINKPTIPTLPRGVVPPSEAGPSAQMSNILNTIGVGKSSNPRSSKPLPDYKRFLGDTYICSWNECRDVISACNYPGDRNAFEANVLAHLTGHLSTASDRSGGLLCQWAVKGSTCTAEASKDLRGIIRHIYGCHQASKGKCDTCHATFSRAETYKKHIITCK